MVKREHPIDQQNERIAERESAAFDLSRKTSSLTSAEPDAAITEREQAEAEILRLRAELQAIFHSTSWRLIGVMRRIAQTLPAQFRRSARETLLRVFRAVRYQSRGFQRSGVIDTSAVPSVIVPVDAAELIRRSGLFDPDWYAAQYPAASHSNDPFSHFIENGLKQNLNPNSHFDASWYLETYPDVEAAGANPLLHFIEWGHLEGRKPSSGFDCNWYRTKYSDAIGVGENCLAHYLRVC
jgi:hypothetical protein